MTIEAQQIVGAAIVGIGATLIMDVWNLFLKRAFNVPSLSYCLVGRWFCHMPSGVFRHESITAASQKKFECAVGYMAHYITGVAFAVAFVIFVSGDWLARPTFLPALFFGMATVAFPFFIMQPSLGFGVAASKTSNPKKARFKSLMTHAVFGMGLYLAALGKNYLCSHS